MGNKTKNTHETFVLNSNERDDLMETLEQPSEPNEALKRAAKDFNDGFGMRSDRKDMDDTDC